jgi:membrane protease YdiL (CAAX protease family)
VPTLHEIALELIVLLILAILCSLLGAGLRYLFVSNRLLPPQRHRAVPWSGVEVILALLIPLVVSVLVAQVLLRLGFFDWLYGENFSLALKDDAPRSLRETASDLVSLWVGTFAFPFQIGGILWVFWSLSRTRPYQLGLTWERAAANVALGAIAWLVVTPLVFLINVGVSYLYSVLVDGPPEGHPLTRVANAEALPIEWVLVILLAIVAAPVFEEILFRGVLQQWFSRRPWGGDAAMAGAFVMALYKRGNSLPEAVLAQDFSEILFELSPALFIVALLPGYLLIDRFAERLFPHGRRSFREGTRWAAQALSWPSPVEPQLRSPFGEWYSARVNQPDGPTALNIARAWYGTAALFAAVHSNTWPSPVPLVLLALVLGWLAFRTQSLLAPVVLHGLFNAVTCVSLLVNLFLSEIR